MHTTVKGVTAALVVLAIMAVVTVVMFGRRRGPWTLLDLVKNEHSDVIVLPETSHYQVQQALKASGFQAVIHDTPDSGLPSNYAGTIPPSTILVSKALGPASASDGPVSSFGTVSLEFADSQLPTVIEIHTAPPLPGLMDEWRSDVQEIVDFAEAHQGPVIMAGDFNATLRHGALARSALIQDAARQCSRTPAGTWPESTPQWFRTPIDHVMLTGELSASECSVRKIGASHHLALTVTVNIY